MNPEEIQKALEADPRFQRLREAEEIEQDRRTSPFVRSFLDYLDQQETDALDAMAQLAPGDTAGLLKLQVDLWASRQAKAWLEQLRAQAKQDETALEAELHVDT